jgi:hypothetical protein
MNHFGGGPRLGKRVSLVAIEQSPPSALHFFEKFFDPASISRLIPGDG